MRPAEPKFHYTDINTSNLNGIVPHIVIDPRLNLMKEQPEFVQFIKLAIEKSIQVCFLLAVKVYTRLH
jgi:CCR4-NOT transcription complex subunit 1